MKASLVLVVLNSVVVLAAAGALFYTKLYYKRPPITEEGERERLAAIHASPTPASVSGTVTFDPVTVNIESTPAQPKAADGTAQQIKGKLHYATVGFALELRDMKGKDQIETIRPILMDKVLSILGRKPFHELTTVQGRYLLRNQILDHANQLVAQGTKDLPITNVFFTTFIVQ